MAKGLLSTDNLFPHHIAATDDVDAVGRLHHAHTLQVVIFRNHILRCLDSHSHGLHPGCLGKLADTGMGISEAVGVLLLGA